METLKKTKSLTWVAFETALGFLPALIIVGLMLIEMACPGFLSHIPNIGPM